MNSNRRKKSTEEVLLRNVTVYSVHMGNLNNGAINLVYLWEKRQKP